MSRVFTFSLHVGTLKDTHTIWIIPADVPPSQMLYHKHLFIKNNFKIFSRLEIIIKWHNLLFLYCGHLGFPSLLLPFIFVHDFSAMKIYAFI